MAYADLHVEPICQGQLDDFAEIVTLGHVTRAKMTQIQSLRLLAPDIQEKLNLL